MAAKRSKDPERMVQADERYLGLRQIDFSDFLFLLKRYGFNDIPFDDILFGKLAPEIGIDHSKFDNERGEDKTSQVCMTFKNPKIFNTGVYKIKNLIILAFLYCTHNDPVSKKEDLWGLIDADMSGQASREEISDFFKLLFYFAINLRHEIE